MIKTKAIKEFSSQREQKPSCELIAKEELVYAQDLKQVLHQERNARANLNRLRHTFLSAVNHDMRTPQALIFQAIEMLEDSRLGSLTEEQLDALMVLRRQAQILGKMIQGVTRAAAFLSKHEAV